MDDGSSRRALRIPVNGFGSFIERLPLPPAREKRWPTIIYDVTAANESRATRVAESPLLATGRGWGTRRIYYRLTPTDGLLRCQTARLAGRIARIATFDPFLSLSLSRMRRYDTAINFPGSRELFHRSRRHFGEFPRVYIFLNKRRDGAKRLFFRDERKYSKGFRFFYETLPFFFRKKARRLAR